MLTVSHLKLLMTVAATVVIIIGRVEAEVEFVLIAGRSLEMPNTSPVFIILPQSPPLRNR